MTPGKAEKDATGTQGPQGCKAASGVRPALAGPSLWGVGFPEGSGRFHQRDTAAQYQERGLWNQTPSSTTHWLCYSTSLCLSSPSVKWE